MELKEFLIKAKKATYASTGEGGEKVLEDGSKELIFKEATFKYRDRYFGFDPFVGEEIVWKEDQLIWAMNYYGKIFGEQVPAKEIYTFLKKALNLVEEKRPFRGPSELEEGDFKYVDVNNGTLEMFEGKEEIFYKGELVYFLYYHGGFLKTKN
ncbi:hypothetical protein HOC80_05325 [archaeon]|jgi:hypothetical protein|nr:hypothetical protein [archaeon]MBT4417493.1 hypothetical protein [archaeon]